MTQTIRDLSKLLSSDPLTVETVAHSLGVIRQAQDGDWPAEVEPRDATFASILVQPQRGTETPAWVEFEISEGHIVTLGELEAAFGQYMILKRMPQQPNKLTFRLDWPSQPYTCTLIAEIPTFEIVRSASTVQRLILRRDIRLG